MANDPRDPHPVALLADPASVAVFEPKRGDGLVRWSVIIGFFVLYVLNCGSFGLWDPWETHYGEVARNMLESYDWVNPWWGYRTQIGTEPVAGNWFYSKPIYIFWSTVTFLKLLGQSDWAFRLPIALLGATMVATVYLSVERIASRRHALMATVVTGLSPFIYMVSRQAQTDMPFVATLSIGMCLLALALFGRRQRLSDRRFALAVLAFVGFYLANLVPQWSIIATDLVDANAGANLSGPQAWGAVVQQNGLYHVLIYLPIALVLLGSILWPIWRQRSRPAEVDPQAAEDAGGGWDDAFKDRWLRRLYLLAFYAMLAQSTYAKGLLGFMLPGAIIFTWLLITGHWRVLLRMELIRGVVFFLLTGLPWYIAMFARHGRAYYNRFIIHDHFNRVGSGVHQIDQGTFEHFIKWLGFGLFPWSGFVPMALMALVWRRSAAHSDSDARVGQFRVLLLAWFAFAFALFTASSTKFHHYILPAAPAATMMVGMYLVDLPRQGAVRMRLHALLALGLFAALLINLMGDVQMLRNLFTYKYDRPLPENLPLDWSAAVNWKSDTHPIVTWADTQFAAHVGPMVAWLLEVRWFRYETFMRVIGVLGGLSLLSLLWARARRVGMVVFTATAGLLAFWALNFYMPMLTPHWSQRYLFEAYYADCTMHPNAPAVEEAYTPLLRRAGLGFISDAVEAVPKRVCQEDIISWLITWRGETYYSNNEIRPINKEAAQFAPYLKDFNRGRPMYVLMERGRTAGFASKLRSESRTLRGQQLEGWTDIKDWRVEIIANGSAYFVLARCTPVRDDGAPRPLPERPPADPDPGQARPAAGTRMPGLTPRLALPSAAPR